MREHNRGWEQFTSWLTKTEKKQQNQSPPKLEENFFFKMIKCLCDDEVDSVDVNFLLTGGSCATPRSSVACWAGSQLCLGSWLSEETSAALWCRSLSLDRLSCRHRAKKTDVIEGTENTFLCRRWHHHWCFPCFISSSEWSRLSGSKLKPSLPRCVWKGGCVCVCVCINAGWKKSFRGARLFGLVLDNVFTIQAFSLRTGYD